MAVKTFTDNTSLGASDINTYLNNGGLVYITQASWASGGTVSVNNCFTSTYSTYRLVIRNSRHATTDVNLLFRLRASGTDATTGYYWGLNTLTFAGANNSSALANTDSIRTIAAGLTLASGGTIDVIDPQKANATLVMTTGQFASTTGEVRFGAGMLNNTTAYDGFSLIASSGNLTALTVLVYGYREA